MPRFHIVREVTAPASFRVSAILDAFDLSTSHVRHEWDVELPVDDNDWQIGVIVGRSGSGKSTLAREWLGDLLITHFDYGSAPVVDEMPASAEVSRITRMFATVGFASPPSWLKPYAVLSNGEKMRVDLARALLEDRPIVAFDEFTSVVDRQVAQVASLALAKAVRQLQRRFVAVTPHRDVLPWLEPDWIYDTDEQRFFVCRAFNGPRSNLPWFAPPSLSDPGSGAVFATITI